jgi:hypothetical protein
VRCTRPDAHMILGEVGNACASARNQPSCSAALEEAGRSLPVVHGIFTYCGFEPYVVTTQGDVVKVWRTPAEQRALFGTLDTASEAFAQLIVQGHYVGCGARNAAYRVVPGGYELRMYGQFWSCSFGPYQEGYQTRFIAHDGSVTITAEELLSGCGSGAPGGS